MIATGRQHSVRQFVELAAQELGIALEWEGEGVNEIGRLATAIDGNPTLSAGTPIIFVDPRYFRPTEVESLLGNAAKARDRLGWQPKVSFEQLVREMVEADMNAANKDALIAQEGYQVFNHHE